MLSALRCSATKTYRAAKSYQLGILPAVTAKDYFIFGKPSYTKAKAANSHTKN